MTVPPGSFGDPNTVEIKEGDPNYKCCFCGRFETKPAEWGDLLRLNGVVTHHFCILFSSNGEQRGADDEGIFGFLPEDILREVRRGKRLNCRFCKRPHATIGCCEGKCPVSFHYTCGYENGCLTQFYENFKSFCPKHRPKQKIPMDTCKECPICFTEVEDEVNQGIWPPCCGKQIFHRSCIMNAAKSAGYFFKCPLCNSKEANFLQAMKANGVFVPDQDAAWEKDNAFRELTERYSQCDAGRCLCPKGRQYANDGESSDEWDIVRCNTCGSSATHMKCSNLRLHSWKCSGCTAVIQDPEYEEEDEAEETVIETENDITLSSDNETDSKTSTSPDAQANGDSSDDEITIIEFCGSSASTAHVQHKPNVYDSDDSQGETSSESKDTAYPLLSITACTIAENEEIELTTVAPHSGINSATSQETVFEGLQYNNSLSITLVNQESRSISPTEIEITDVRSLSTVTETVENTDTTTTKEPENIQIEPVAVGVLESEPVRTGKKIRRNKYHESQKDKERRLATISVLTGIGAVTSEQARKVPPIPKKVRRPPPKSPEPATVPPNDNGQNRPEKILNRRKPRRRSGHDNRCRDARNNSQSGDEPRSLPPHFHGAPSIYMNPNKTLPNSFFDSIPVQRQPNQFGNANFDSIVERSSSTFQENMDRSTFGSHDSPRSRNVPFRPRRYFDSPPGSSTTSPDKSGQKAVNNNDVFETVNTAAQNFNTPEADTYSRSNHTITQPSEPEQSGTTYYNRTNVQNPPSNFSGQSFGPNNNFFSNPFPLNLSRVQERLRDIAYGGDAGGNVTGKRESPPVSRNFAFPAETFPNRTDTAPRPLPVLPRVNPPPLPLLPRVNQPPQPLLPRATNPPPPPTGNKVIETVDLVDSDEEVNKGEENSDDDIIVEKIVPKSHSRRYEAGDRTLNSAPYWQQESYQPTNQYQDTSYSPRPYIAHPYGNVYYGGNEDLSFLGNSQVPGSRDHRINSTATAPTVAAQQNPGSYDFQSHHQQPHHQTSEFSVVPNPHAAAFQADAQLFQQEIKRMRFK